MKNQINKDVSRARREVAQGSIWAFAQIYLKHHLKLVPSEAHQQVYEILYSMQNTRGQKHAFAAPREFGKSTLITLIYIIWCICFQRERFIVIVSNTLSLSTTILENIKTELVENKLIMEDFPEVFEVYGKPKPPKWTREEIITRTGIKVVAFGKGKSVRGIRFKQYRPTLIIADDVEKGNAYSSIESLEKDKDWFRKTILKLGSKDTNTIILGTNFNPYCMLGDLLDKEKSPDWTPHVFQALESWPENKELWAAWANIFNSREQYEGEVGPEAAKEFYTVNKAVMDVGAKPLWPEKWDIYSLMVESEIDPVVFSSERQNTPIDPKTQIFSWDELHFWSDEYNTFEDLLKSTSGDVSYYGACDPAMGGDYTAIIVLMRDNQTKLWYVIVADIVRRNVHDAINDIVEYAKRFHFTKFVVESNNFQQLMVDELKRRCKEVGVPLWLEPIKSVSHKKERIRAMQPVIRTGAVKFHKGHKILLEQLCYFPMHANDDGPDALEMALSSSQFLGKVQVRIIERKDNWWNDYRRNLGWEF